MRSPGLPSLPRGSGLLLGGGVLLAAAFPPFRLVVPSFVGLVPWALWTAELPDGPEGRREAFRGGVLFGLVHFGIVLHWIALSLLPRTSLAVAAFLLTVGVLAGLLGAATLGVHRSVRELRAPLWLAVPVFWTAAEWVRAHLGPFAFPWMELGESLAAAPRLAGAADLVGSRGLSFWLALTSGLVADLLRRLRRPRGSRGPGGFRRPAVLGAGEGDAGAGGALRPAVLRAAGIRVFVLLAVVALPLGYSIHRWETLRLRPAARVAVVQPNVPEEGRLEERAAADSARRAIDALIRRQGWTQGRLDLLVLPEATFPLPLEPVPDAGHAGAPELASWSSELARGLETRLLYGAIGVGAPGGERNARAGARAGMEGAAGREEEGDRRPDDRTRNSAYLLGRDGERIDRYDKRRLVPLIERVPWPAAAGLRGGIRGLLGPWFGGHAPGRRSAPLAVDGDRFGVLICYESAFSRLSGEYRRGGADFLVNLTNDAWFGREAPVRLRTSALFQHPAHLVLRAVETRAGVVRAASTGISGVVDPLGRWRIRTPLFEPAAFAARVMTTGGVTLYARRGDVVGGASAICAALAFLALGAKVRPGRWRRERTGEKR